MIHPLSAVQAFYKTNLSLACSAGITKIYVSTLPTTSVGYLVISGPDLVKREVIYHTAKGTDSTGNFVNVTDITDRGMCGTTAQTHEAQESIRANITPAHWDDLINSISVFIPISFLDIDGTLSANSDTKIPSQKAVKTYSDTKIPFSYLDTDITLAANSDTRIPSQRAIKQYVINTYVAGGGVNASTTNKGFTQIPTQTQVDTGVDTGSTGALMSVLPSQLQTVVQASNGASLIAGEAITAGDAVIVSSGNESGILNAISTQNTTFEGTNTAVWIYQSFTTGPNTTKINRVDGLSLVSGTGGSGVGGTLRIRATPTGADLISTGVTFYGSGGDQGWSANLGNLAVSSNTTYYIVISSNPGGGNCAIKGGTTSSYSGGVSARSTDSGASWTSPSITVTGDFYFTVFESYTVAGRIYKTNANTTLFPDLGWTNNFIGFAKTTVTAGATVPIQLNNVYAGLSALSAGVVYYLANTPGAISATAGTVSKKIGLALSATSILIKHDN